MELDRWFGSYKVRSFPWVDGERIYFNVQYYRPGQSMERQPVWDKTVYIVNNDAGKRLVSDFTYSLIELISSMQIEDDTEVTITV